MVKRAPSVFLDLTRPLSPLAICSDMGFSPGYPAIVRNEDGTLNSCEHRAFKGSVVTFYLNGLGQTAPLVTLSSPQAGQILAVEADPDSPSGVWRVIVRLATNASSGPLEPRIDGARLRYGFLAVWIIQ